MQNNDSNKFSNEDNKLLDMVKQYLGIEHQEKEKDLDYLRKQGGSHPDKWPDAIYITTLVARI